MEFYPFNKALQLTSQQGFRTFLKTEDRRLYEPFQRKKKEEIKQKMLISSEELEIDEVNSELGMETNVLYFPLASEPVPALVRKLKVKNLNDQPLELELIDGLPRILPHGLNQDHVKFTARHIEAMMGIEWANDVPLFRLKQSPEDIAQIEKIPGGNFYLSLLGREKISSDNLIVDPDVIFGESGSYEHPWTFESNSLQSILGMEETQENKTPCAFTALPLELSPGEEIILYSMIGNVSEEEKLRLLLESVEQRISSHKNARKTGRSLTR